MSSQKLTRLQSFQTEPKGQLDSNWLWTDSEDRFAPILPQIRDGPDATLIQADSGLCANGGCRMHYWCLKHRQLVGSKKGMAYGQRASSK
jgi:hypothetical protein